MRKWIALLTLSAALFLFLLSGCNDSGSELSRYPRIAIPGYADKDYYPLLSDKNNEIVRNAVCNLIDHASSMGTLLSDEKTDKNAAEFILASNTYKKITELLQSRDGKIVSASLRFLQLFGPKYNKREELVEYLLKVKNRSQNVRYEQLVALNAIASQASRISDAFLIKSLKDPSWLVSRAAYSLVNTLKNDKIRLMLAAKYGSKAAEYEKLLILTAMKDDFSNDIFKFLSKEVFETKNDKIKDFILSALRNAHDTAEALKWVDENYEKLLPEEIARISDDKPLYDDFTSALYIICIKKGWMPDNGFFGDLYQNINLAKSAGSEEDLSEDDIRNRANLLNVEKAIMDSQIAGPAWAVFKNEKDMLAKSIAGEIKAEYAVIVNQFSEKAGGILDKYNVGTEKKKEFCDMLPSVFMNEEAFDKAVGLFQITAP
ncbi:MAG: hypothetical protein PHI59_02130 [Candidatus Omnitrophica bacterium]|nr:hypothetical protein [Candidatus Omnitrophota bacterium]